MALKRRQRIIILLYILILLENYFTLINGQMNQRKMESPNDNSDNYIMVYFSDDITYGTRNLFNKGNRDMVSYIKFQGNIIEKESLNQVITIRTNQNPLEIHFSSCVSSLEGFFGCFQRNEYFDSNAYYMISTIFLILILPV